MHRKICFLFTIPKLCFYNIWSFVWWGWDVLMSLNISSVIEDKSIIVFRQKLNTHIEHQHPKAVKQVYAAQIPEKNHLVKKTIYEKRPYPERQSPKKRHSTKKDILRKKDKSLKDKLLKIKTPKKTKFGMILFQVRTRRINGVDISGVSHGAIIFWNKF